MYNDIDPIKNCVQHSIRLAIEHNVSNDKDQADEIARQQMEEDRLKQEAAEVDQLQKECEADWQRQTII